MMTTPCSTGTQINLRTVSSCCTGAMPVAPRKITLARSQKCVSTVGGNSDPTMDVNNIESQEGCNVRREPQYGVHY